MHAISDVELVFLRDLMTEGGHRLIDGNHDHGRWDNLVQLDFIARTPNTENPDTFHYTITPAGRDAVKGIDRL